MKTTSLDPEEYAYPAGSLRSSRRFAMARCPDGKVHRVKIGLPDTFFSIPGTCQVRGVRVAGYVCFADDGEVEFRPYLYRKNHAVFARALDGDR